jgi:hypothetical protein
LCGRFLCFDSWHGPRPVEGRPLTTYPTSALPVPTRERFGLGLCLTCGKLEPPAYLMLLPPNTVLVQSAHGSCSPGSFKLLKFIILGGKPDGKRPLGRPRRRWVDNIKIDLREMGWDGMGWTGSIWLRVGTSGGLL